METPTTYSGVVNFVIDFINLLIPAIFALIFGFMVWKVVDSWVLHADDPGKVAEGKLFAVTAVLVLVVMLSFWGIVALLRSSFLPGA